MLSRSCVSVNVCARNMNDKLKDNNVDSCIPTLPICTCIRKEIVPALYFINSPQLKSELGMCLWQYMMWTTFIIGKGSVRVAEVLALAT